MAIFRLKAEDNNGNDAKETTFVDCDAFGRTAEVINQYLHKGDPIHIEGRLRFRQWETDNQEKRNKLSVVIDRFEFIRTRQEAENSVTTEQEFGGNASIDAPPAQHVEGANIPF